ncbi:hypothetical protein FQV22_0005434, partial [Spheniscus magellanicus]
EKQRELARKGSLKNGNMGSPVNQQPKKNNVMARTRPLVAARNSADALSWLFHASPCLPNTSWKNLVSFGNRLHASFSRGMQINQDLNIQLLKDGYRLDEIPDDEDLDLIPPKSVNPTCMCCQATSSTACHIQ